MKLVMEKEHASSAAKEATSQDAAITDNKIALIENTASIVSAYVASNEIAVDGIPALIKTVHTSLAGLLVEETAAEPEPPVLTPAVHPKRSVFPDYIICLEDGKKLKMLKRHLHAAYNMTPEEYRKRWNLPSDYPMTAPNYAERRKEIAISSRLGQKTQNTEQDAAEPASEQPPAKSRSPRQPAKDAAENASAEAKAARSRRATKKS